MTRFRSSLLAAALLAAVAVPATIAATAPALAAEAAAQTLSLAGEGSASAVPDQATVTSGVTSEGKTAREAVDANSKAMGALIDAFKKAGIQPADLQTSGFSVQPRYTNSGGGLSSSGGSDEPPRIDGYEVRNQVSVRIRDLTKLGAILDTAVEAGSNQIDGVNFGLADPTPVLDKAREAAVADARRKAELIAKAAGVKLGRIVTIVESGADQGPRPMIAAYAMEKAAAVPIQAGESEFTARVTVTWEIAQ
ncbi:SIMPL domain-containing protein [Inquilinus sp. Marseille-Q2685]|uniref:SIMPL domain-containing protein n=1 Tax=Inquilinus sp. Marseille-Q2685 TaxID=2866581 RepID=UPI001CE481A1|nr:SIMPL domain-containing protein [Inquilinus sp. Marseille-Q2685]